MQEALLSDAQFAFSTVFPPQGIYYNGVQFRDDREHNVGYEYNEQRSQLVICGNSTNTARLQELTSKPLAVLRFFGFSTEDILETNGKINTTNVIKNILGYPVHQNAGLFRKIVGTPIKFLANISNVFLSLPFNLLKLVEFGCTFAELVTRGLARRATRNANNLAGELARGNANKFSLAGGFIKVSLDPRFIIFVFACSQVLNLCLSQVFKLGKWAARLVLSPFRSMRIAFQSSGKLGMGISFLLTCTLYILAANVLLPIAGLKLLGMGIKIGITHLPVIGKTLFTWMSQKAWPWLKSLPNNLSAKMGSFFTNKLGASTAVSQIATSVITRVTTGTIITSLSSAANELKNQVDSHVISSKSIEVDMSERPPNLATKLGSPINFFRTVLSDYKNRNAINENLNEPNQNLNDAEDGTTSQLQG